MTIPIGNLVIEMSASQARLIKDMGDAKKTVDDAMSGIKKSAETAKMALEAIGVGMTINAFKDWVHGAIEAADAINDMSKATGVAVTQLAGLKLAAKQSGGDLEGIAASINKLSVNIGNNSEKFAKIGITAKDPLEALKQLADVFVQVQDPQLRAALGAEALGKSWASAAPLLMEGSARIGEMVAKGQELSNMTPEFAAAADKFNDILAEMKARSEGVANSMAKELLPLLTVLAESMNEAKRSTSSMSLAMEGVRILFETIVVLGANVAFTLKTVAQQTIAVVEYMATIAGGGGFEMAAKVSENMRIEAEKSRKELDDFTDRVLRSKQNGLGVIEETTKATEAETAAVQKNVRAFLDSNKEKAAGVDLYAKMIKQADDLVAAIEFETKTLTMNNVEKETAVALQKLATFGIKEGTAEYIKYADAIIAATLDKAQVQSIVDSNKKIAEEQAADLKKLEDAQKKAQEDAVKQMQDVSNQIGQSLSDALMNGGKSASQYLQDLFRTLVLRPIVQPLITGMVSSVMMGASGTALADGTAGATGGSMSGSMGLMGAVSSIKNLYGMVTGGFASLGASVTSMTEGLGASLMLENAAGSSLSAAGESLVASAGTLGTAASVLGGLGAGLGIGNMISGGLGVGGGSSWLSVGAGTALGMAVAGPLGAAVGGVLGGLVNKMFGTGAKEYGDNGISGTFSSNGNNVSQYQEWSKAGGWFGGGGSGSDMSPVDAQLSKYLSTQIASSAIAVKQYATALGLSAQGIAGFTYDIKLSLQGLTADEATKKISELIAAYGNTLASVVTAEIGPFMRDGEEAGATLARLATSLTGVNGVLGTLNLKLEDVSLYGADAASKLTDMFGGLDKLIAATDYYYQNFYSAQERASKTTEQLTGVFGQLGLTLPATNAGFRAMVESARAAGNDGLFAALIKLAPTFNDLQTATAALHTSLVQSADAAFSAVQSAAQTEQAAALAAIEQQKVIVQAAQQSATASLASLTSIFDYLKGQVSEILQTVDIAQTAAQGAAFIRQALLTAQSTGYLPDQTSLSGAVSAARGGMASSNFATAFDMKQSQMQLAADLQGLQDIAGDQKTTAQLQLDAANEQLAALDAQTAITTAYYTSQIAYAQSQVNELKGINNGVLTLAQAMSAFGVSVGAAGGGDLSSQISQMYQEILGRTPDSPGLSNWLGSGMSLDEIRTGILGSQEAKARGYAVGGAYPGGMALVGEQGPELINFRSPGMVYTAAQTQGLMSGGSDAADELRQLREDMRAQALAQVQLNTRVAKVLERWDGDGIPETRVVTA